jgi:hypothetical protein
VAAYRLSQGAKSTFGRGDSERAEAAIRAGLVSAADPFGIPSWLIGQVSPATKDLIREQYEDHPIASTVGSFATSIPRFVMRGAEIAAKAAPKTLATVLGLGGLATSSDEAEGAGRLPISKAARIRRADAAGFWRNVSLEAGRAPLGEEVEQAAVKVGERVFTGPKHLGHLGAMQRAERELGIPMHEMNLGWDWDGFVTTGGRYVTRQQATDIAGRAGQGEATGAFAPTRELTSEDVTRMAAPGTPPSSKSLTAATAPDLPGGDGTWAWVLPESTASGAGSRLPQPSGGSAVSNQTALTWARTERPKEIDAHGRLQGEVYDELKRAWEQGHDAVWLANYTAPSGRTGDVLVVRDLAQLRDPKAKFDPRKSNSPNVMAGFAGAGLFGPYFAGVPFSFPDRWPGSP